MAASRSSLSPRARRVLYVLAGLFIASILWSMWVDTLRPLVRAGDAQAAALTALGLAVLLLGTALIVRGGWSTLTGMYRFMGSPEVKARIAIIREKGRGRRAAQRANVAAWWSALREGVLWMLLGFGGIALGGWLINP